MVTCVIKGCKSTSGKISKDKDGISFHRFPRDKNRKRQWEIAVDRGDSWTSTPSSAVCSEHFKSTDFYLTENGLRRLSVDAVPCINISSCEKPEPTVLQLPIIDIKPTDTAEVIQLKQRVRWLEIIARHRQRRLKAMWQSKRALRKKLEAMKAMVKHLVKSKNIESSIREVDVDR